MRRAPRQLLHVDADARMRAFERRQQLRDNFAFAAHRPEADDGIVAAPRAAGTKHRGGAGASERCKQPAPVAANHFTSAVSQPPENPARVSPSRTYALSRITFQMSPLR